ncbi:MAG: hypothetical protein ACYDDE_01515 [bacterium]
MNKYFNLFLVGGILLAGYYGLKNKDPKLLALAGAKLLILGLLTDKS